MVPRTKVNDKEKTVRTIDIGWPNLGTLSRYQKPMQEHGALRWSTEPVRFIDCLTS